MEYYIINKNTGDKNEHEVHLFYSCNHLPKPENIENLGYCSNYEEAKQKAIRLGYKAVSIDGCKHCLPFYHTK